MNDTRRPYPGTGTGEVAVHATSALPMMIGGPIEADLPLEQVCDLAQYSADDDRRPHRTGADSR